MKNKKFKINNQNGQSTIEFIFSFSFITFLLVYTIKVAVNYTTGYLVHYATFMAGRTYYVYEDNSPNDNTAMTKAREVFERTNVSMFNSNVANTGELRFTNINDPASYVHAGVYYDWETSFSVGGVFGGSQALELRSESYLGREPNRQACGIRTCQVMRGDSGACDMGRAFTVSDNGC